MDIDMDMDIDVPSEPSIVLSSRDRIIARLARLGVPEEFLRNYESGLVDFLNSRESLIPQVVSGILPPDEEMANSLQKSKSGSKKVDGIPSLREQLRECTAWLMWLMFKGNPTNVLKYLSEINIGQQGVCGAVWGNNDIAYRCRTCEHDPTCAICVPCFENGDHKGHDYSTIYTGGGCCDCGDVTAWKREGFCSKHRGAEQIQPLPEEIASSVEPVLDALLVCWKDKLLFAESSCQEKHRAGDYLETKRVASDFTFVVVEMLLQFCKCSESLLRFVSSRVCACTGLLEILVRAEKTLSESFVKKLHELLLKLLADPSFKYEFAKAFLQYYPTFVGEAVREGNDEAFKKYGLLSMFSVQILTVPTLTPRLVKEMNLLAMLFGCLGSIFISCSDEDGRLQVTKWQGLYETTIRVVQDIHFVLSHVVVPKYVLHEQRDILRTWMKLLAFVQGMNPQKRETGIHIEEEIENTHLPFGLYHSIANIHSLIVDGAFSDVPVEDIDDKNVFKNCETNEDDEDSLRHAKVGRLSQGSSACGSAERSYTSSCISKSAKIGTQADCLLMIPQSVTWLIHECLRAIDGWLLSDNTSGAPSSISSISGSNFSSFKKTFLKITKSRHVFSRLSSSSDRQAQPSSSALGDFSSRGDLDSIIQQEKLVGTREVDSQEVPSVAFDNPEDTVSAAGSEALRLLSLSEWPNIYYDVSLQDISIHIPLHRLLSLLLQKALKGFSGESTAMYPAINKPLVVYSGFFESVLRGHPLGFSAFIMEHPLRIRVFCAEVRAGMWKKNGEAAVLSREWYRSVRWSEQGLDLDLFLLQFCAALAPADLYVSRILERFGLLDYLTLNPSQIKGYEAILVHEMLSLIIQLAKERRFCGLTTVESLRRELVYKLAAGDATHSQILKSLPRDLAKSAQLQEVLDTVATYSNPSGFNQGMYSLRGIYWKDLDLYHPRWNSRDLQVAEEKYARFCGVSALTAQLPRWSPVYAPLSSIAGIATCKVTLQIIRAVLFYAFFSDKSSKSRAPEGILITALHLLSLGLDICFQQRNVGNGTSNAECSVPMLVLAVEEIDDGLSYDVGKLSLLSLLVLLMKFHKKENVGNIHDAGSCDLASLIERLLKKFAELDPCCLIKLQQLAPELVGNVTQSASSTEASISCSASDAEKRKAKARERQAAIMAKMRAEQSKFLASIDKTDESLSSGEEFMHSTHETQGTAQDVCSLCRESNPRNPLSFLVHIQRSRVSSLVDRGPPSWNKVQDVHKDYVCTKVQKETDQHGLGNPSNSSEDVLPSQFSQLVQDAINKFACNGQPWEVNSFLDYVNERFPLLRNIQVPHVPNHKKESTSFKFETLEQDMYNLIRREAKANEQQSKLMDIQSDNITRGEISSDWRDVDTSLLAKYIASLSRERAEDPSGSENVHRDETVGEHTERISASDGFSAVGCDGIFLSSCGHAVHQGCLDSYLSSLKERSIRRIAFETGHTIDLDQGEFLCPLCRRLANSFLPALSTISQAALKQPMNSNLDFSQCPFSISGVNITSLHLPEALFILQSAGNVVKKGELLKAFPRQSNVRLRTKAEPFFGVLSKMFFQSKEEKPLGITRVSRSAIMWDTLRYSIVLTEISARCGRTSLAPKIGLDSLYKELTSSGRFILSLFLKIIQSIRSKDTIDVLQRYRGIKLYADSVCFGVSSDNRSSTAGQEGHIIDILKDGKKEVCDPDIQFWKRAADPILAHDPFSSLMWVLFCLPLPFLSCKESFLSLVHIFYGVAFAQAAVWYCGNCGSNANDLDVRDCLITDIIGEMGRARSAAEYFFSNYIDPSFGLSDVIRSLIFPYLRRCALLWKLLNSSVSAPFCDMDQELDVPSPSDSRDDHMASSFVDYNEIEKLEKMFMIPPVDNVLKDQNMRILFSRWFHHFCKELELHRFSQMLPCTPAVPFKLMQLPQLYQDLLQRYIKQQCVDCKSLLDEPALCLLCGRLCSPNWKPCCSANGCQNHAMSCGAGTGVFLLIRRTTILLQRSARQASWPSPYLDAFGEEDMDILRGKPLYLNEERYAALTYMVASHGLERSSKFLRQATLGAFLF